MQVEYNMIKILYIHSFYFVISDKVHEYKTKSFIKTVK